MAAAATLIVSAIKAAACRMRSCLEDTCSQGGHGLAGAEPAEHAQPRGELGVGPERPAWMR